MSLFEAASSSNTQKNEFSTSFPKTLYHVTQKSRLPSILKKGLVREYFGDIHGKMNIQPPEPTVYLSASKQSNNLNGRLLDESDRDPMVVIEINPAFIDPSKIYPDDALFIGFAQEDVFENAEEIAEALQITKEEAQTKLDHWESLTDQELVQDMKALWPWYLADHGEISVAQDVPVHAIMAVRDYQTGEYISGSPVNPSQESPNAGARRRWDTGTLGLG